MRAKHFLLVLAIALVTPAVAFEGPKVEYSGDSYMETAEGTMQGKVYSTPGRERREFVQQGERQIMIMHRDKKVVWMLMPEDKMYMEMKIPKEGRKDDLSGYKMETTRVGTETVNGVSTTKNKIIMTAPNGDKLGGFSWVSKEGIVVKLDAIAVEKNNKQRMKMELKNLKIGKQNPAMFEIPAGYTKMDMGSMMMGGGKNTGREPEVKGGEDKKDSFGIKDAIKLFK